MKILSTCFHEEFPAWTLPQWCVDEVIDSFTDIEFVRLTSSERIADEIVDADVLMAWRVDEDMFRLAQKLRWIHTGMAGLTWILIPPVVESQVVVSNGKGVHPPIMGEHAMALMLAFSRRLHDCLEFQRKAVWGRNEIYSRVPSFEGLCGKTVGIVGFGAIGAEVGRRARSFQMRVIGFKRNVDQDEGLADILCEPGELNDYLPEIDYLIIAAPLTEETEGMIGPVQLELMKSTAVLINLARGELIDQEALAAALENEQIAGAGLDVFVPDPLPDGHPLFSTKNLILTPHVSGTSPDMWRHITTLFIKNIKLFREGQELINQVNKERGY